ncbi:hypothetical protein MOQ_010079, partial [Trypanosoma cruzi marinkellei]
FDFGTAENNPVILLQQCCGIAFMRVVRIGAAQSKQYSPLSFFLAFLDVSAACRAFSSFFRLQRRGRRPAALCARLPLPFCVARLSLAVVACGGAGAGGLFSFSFVGGPRRARGWSSRSAAPGRAGLPPSAMREAAASPRPSAASKSSSAAGGFVRPWRGRRRGSEEGAHEATSRQKNRRRERETEEADKNNGTQNPPARRRFPPP